MGTKAMPKAHADLRESLHAHEKRIEAVIDAAGGVGGAALGAAIGSIAGPPGAIAGAIIGGAIGTASAAVIETVEHERAKHDAELDEEIGVTSENLGSAPPPAPKASTDS
jgi:hypothetical protein